MDLARRGVVAVRAFSIMRDVSRAGSHSHRQKPDRPLRAQ